MTDEVAIRFGIVILIIAVLLALKAFSRRQEAKKEAKEFLLSLEDHLYSIFIKIISEIDLTKFNNFKEYEEYALDKLYDGSWEFIEKKIESYDNKDLISALAKKFLTKEYIDKFVKEYIDKINTEENLRNNYGTNSIEEKSDEIVQEDKELADKYSNQEEYNEEVDKETYEYELAKEEEHTQEEIDSLNPQQDIDEEEYSDGDDSVEEIKSYIELKTNKLGRNMYYLIDENGKRQQISKANALASGLDIKVAGDKNAS